MLITIGNCHRSPVTSLSITDIHIPLITSLPSLSAYPAAVTYDQGRCPVPLLLSYKAMKRARLFCKTKLVTNSEKVSKTIYNGRQRSSCTVTLDGHLELILAFPGQLFGCELPHRPCLHATWQETNQLSLPRCASVGAARKSIRQS